MKRWPWFERHFNFDYPPEKFPDLLERLRGTPLRVEALIAGVRPQLLTADDGQGWTIQQNIGHLIDVETLWVRRFEQLVAGESNLVAADLTNAATNAADHNNRSIDDLLASFCEGRYEFTSRLETQSEDMWFRSAVHPRLEKQMRLVDLVHFTCEHDDYHLARIRQIVRNDV